jgi:chromosomal replication initiator protein
MWIEPLRPARWSGQELTLEAPSVFVRNWLRRHFLADLERAVSTASGSQASVTLVVNHSLEVPVRNGRAPAHRATSASTPVAPPARYGFESFVVGGSNQVAHAAAQAVVAQPGARFNPLFISGGCGVGKTHLSYATAHGANVARPQGVVVCMTAENFVNELLGALRRHQMERFRRRFRSIDMLIIDDIQFLCGKRRSQEEFYHTFDALRDSRKQIVIASDRAPHELPGIEDTLRSRFASGLLARIDPPDPALRRALVRRKADGLGLRLDPETAEYLADEWCSNVRELEGALVRVELYAILSARAVDLSLVREALGVPPGARGSLPTIERVIGEVCHHFQVTRQEIASVRRTARIVVPRHLAMYLARHCTDAPLNRIGEELGGRDHSTVLHALSAIERRLKTDVELRRTLADLRARLRAS